MLNFSRRCAKSKKPTIRKNINLNTISNLLRNFGVMLVLLALAACGGVETSPPTSTTGIGPSGGTVTGPNGAKVVIPQGALTRSTNISIAQTNVGAPALPSSVTSIGARLAFTPHGTTFKVPVTITVPFNTVSLPAGSIPRLLKTNAAQNAFEAVAGATVSGNTMTAQVSSFSFLQVVIPTPENPIDPAPDPNPNPDPDNPDNPENPDLPLDP
jgi:hypothetical protein